MSSRDLRGRRPGIGWFLAGYVGVAGFLGLEATTREGGAASSLVWTPTLLRHAASVTAVDAASERLAIASARIDDDRVRLIEADVFSWRPDRRYDVVFFGFWLSHVPLERFESFWSLVGERLAPDGRVFFVDDGYRTPQELIEGERSSTIRRLLNDGSAYRAVKVALTPSGLEARLSRLGWRITVTPTSGPFFWGSGTQR